MILKIVNLNIEAVISFFVLEVFLSEITEISGEYPIKNITFNLSGIEPAWAIHVKGNLKRGFVKRVCKKIFF